MDLPAQVGREGDALVNVPHLSALNILLDMSRMVIVPKVVSSKRLGYRVGTWFVR